MHKTTSKVGAEVLREKYKNEGELANLFSRERREIYGLLKGCFSRFKSTKLFEDWKPSKIVEP